MKNEKWKKKRKKEKMKKEKKKKKKEKRERERKKKKKKPMELHLSINLYNLYTGTILSIFFTGHLSFKPYSCPRNSNWSSFFEFYDLYQRSIKKFYDSRYTLYSLIIWWSYDVLKGNVKYLMLIFDISFQCSSLFSVGEISYKELNDYKNNLF